MTRFSFFLLFMVTMFNTFIFFTKPVVENKTGYEVLVRQFTHGTKSGVTMIEVPHSQYVRIKGIIEHIQSVVPYARPVNVIIEIDPYPNASSNDATGFIVINSSFLAYNDDSILFILSHEMKHYMFGDSERTRSYILSRLKQLGLDLLHLSELDKLNISKDLIIRQREVESDADLIAVDTMKKLGYSCDKIVAISKDVFKDWKDNSPISPSDNHPTDYTRVKDIEYTCPRI